MFQGACYVRDDVCEFTVWAPYRKEVALKLPGDSGEGVIPMRRQPKGYWITRVEGINQKERYLFMIDGKLLRADPASNYQPEGVHGPSEVVDHSEFKWSDESWRGMNLSDTVIYEIHVGTFTEDGVLEAIIPRLDEIADLGINTIELMPIAQFPGERNWGYDGVYPYAVQNSYGGPKGLKKLVDKCHSKGIATILDVVYNHVGPEGNHLNDYGPYFSSKYKTPWGEAINFDGPGSDEVRSFFIDNAIHWFTNYHIDSLRLDAVHAMLDLSATHFLKELSSVVESYSRSMKRKYYVIAESDLNDPRIIRAGDVGGYELDAQWLDDFHHVLHTLLTCERQGYYADYGKLEHLIKVLNEGFILSGQYSTYRQRRHGASSRDIPPSMFIVFAQNHDQVGNRMLGERLTGLVSFEALKLAAGAILLSPYIPLVFMGEEYGEVSPFQYFVSHSDPLLVDAVRKGRREEFNRFEWKGEPPDPQDPLAFQCSKLNWALRTQGRHAVLLDFYKSLIHLRRNISLYGWRDRNSIKVHGVETNRTLSVLMQDGGKELMAVYCFSDRDTETDVEMHVRNLEKIFDSADEQWGGPGSCMPKKISSENRAVLRAYSFAVYTSGDEHG